METMVLVAPTVYDAELRSRLGRLAADAVHDTSDGVVVTDGVSRVYIAQCTAVRDDLEPEQLEMITSAIPNPVFYCIDFSDIVLCRRVLAAVADDPSILIDNDHGVLLPGHRYLEAMRARPEWDWREDLE